MVTPTSITNLPRPRRLTLGSRTRREIELRIHELEARLNPKVYDLAELARLRELLNQGDGNA